jgi:hypothetical protein
MYYSTSLGSIIRQTLPGRTHRLESVELRHLGEIARRNSRTDFTEYLLGYFFVFPFSFAHYYSNLESAVLIEIAAATLGLILGNMAARVVPHNL